VKRTAHTLKRNKSSTFPENLVFVDTETTQEQTGKREVTHSLRLGVACYWHKDRTGVNRSVRWMRFTLAAEFWDWMVSKKEWSCFVSSAKEGRLSRRLPNLMHELSVYQTAGE